MVSEGGTAPKAHGFRAPSLRLTVMPRDGRPPVIRWTNAAGVGVVVVAAVASSEHAYELMLGHGEAGWTAQLSR
jgi:hypothetical protein